MNIIQENIINKFKKALNDTDVKIISSYNRKYKFLLYFGIFFILIATLITFIKTFSNIINLYSYIFSFWPSLIIGSCLIIAYVYLDKDLDIISIQEHLIKNGFDVYSLYDSIDDRFDYIQEFGNLIYSDTSKFLYNDQNTVHLLKEIFLFKNNITILSKEDLSEYFAFEIPKYNNNYFLYNNLYGYLNKSQLIALDRFKTLLIKRNSEENQEYKFMIDNELQIIQKYLNLPFEIIVDKLLPII